MLPAFATETIKVFYPKVVTSRGTTQYVPQTDDLNMIHVSGCSVQPTTTSSNLSDPRDQTMTLMTAWIPSHEWARVIAGGPAHDLIMEWRGQQFLQYGDSMDWISPTGTLDHVQVYIRRYRG